jgi:hypothetical protein
LIVTKLNFILALLKDGKISIDHSEEAVKVHRRALFACYQFIDISSLQSVQSDYRVRVGQLRECIQFAAQYLLKLHMVSCLVTQHKHSCLVRVIVLEPDDATRGINRLEGTAELT